MLSSLFTSTLSHALMISAFVLFMMVLIEYINIQTRNIWSGKLKRSPFMQIVTATLLGIMPGCLGAFTAVSLYTHRLIGLSGLVAVMIATSGDEAFVMFALFPGKALLLHALLFLVAILAGWAVHLLFREKNPTADGGFVVHAHESCKCFSKELIMPQLKRISFERSLLLLLTAVFILLLMTGVVGPPEWNWKKITFMAGSLFMLFVFTTVPDHFLKEHFYHHVLKKHLLRIFLWTWGAFILLHFLEANLELAHFLQHKAFLMLIAAVLLGIIPESGPHLVLVTLFAEGLLPFSILLANSIVQDGHGMLPLLAESRADFIRVKAINLVIGFMIGALFMLAGY